MIARGCCDPTGAPGVATHSLRWAPGNVTWSRGGSAQTAPFDV